MDAAAGLPKLICIKRKCENSVNMISRGKSQDRSQLQRSGFTIYKYLHVHVPLRSCDTLLFHFSMQLTPLKQQPIVQK